jgi:hypothetical protein
MLVLVLDRGWDSTTRKPAFSRTIAMRIPIRIPNIRKPVSVSGSGS